MSHKVTARDIFFGDDSRKRFVKGAELFSRAVTMTYGPKGLPVILDRAAGILITKDGVTVAREVDLEDPVENLAAQVLKEASIQVNAEAGDGTTSVVCIANKLISELAKLIVAGYDPGTLAREIQEASLEVQDFLEYGLALPIEGQEQVERVALIASNQDEEVASKMAEAVMAVGKNGTVSIEDGSGIETTLEFKEGLEFDRGVVATEFLKGKHIREAEKPVVAVVAQELKTVEDVLDLCEEATVFDGTPLVIFCYGLTGEALKTVMMNDQNKEHDFQFIPIVSPGNFDRRKEYLGDIAAFTGAKLIDPEQGDSTKKWNQEWFGAAEKISVWKDKTIIVGFEDLVEANIPDRVEHIKSQYQLATTEYDRERLDERLAFLEGGLCVMRIGAYTEAELKEKRARVEDALGAVQSALRTGIVPGGGISYLAASQILSEENTLGEKVLKKALQEPFRTLVDNASQESSTLLAKMLEQREDPQSWLGFNLYEDSFQDFEESFAVIDPLQVALSVVATAVSVASTLLTTEVSIVLKK